MFAADAAGKVAASGSCFGISPARRRLPSLLHCHSLVFVVLWLIMRCAFTWRCIPSLPPGPAMSHSENSLLRRTLTIVQTSHATSASELPAHWQTNAAGKLHHGFQRASFHQPKLGC